jgi:hypothetical protein
MSRSSADLFRFARIAGILWALIVCLACVSQPCLGQPSSGDLSWKGQWIAADPETASSGANSADGRRQFDPQMPIFRKEFSLVKPVLKSTLRISGLGQFEVHLNGRKVGNSVLTPGWTDYRKRIFYETYDVTALLRRGSNAIGILLGNGMYNVVETKGRYTKFSNSLGQPKLIAQLELTFADGKTETIGSNDSWKSAPGPITFSSIYGGEDYDARLEQSGWDRAGFAATGWKAAAISEGPGGKLVPETIPPVKAFDTYRPVAITHPLLGIAVYDLGQNFAGWPEIAVQGKRGARVKLFCGELLDKDGRVTQRSANGFPDSQYSFNYVLKGGGVERWSPRFSYYGFRYVEVQTTAKDSVRVVRLAGRFIHDAVTVNGHFQSSDKLFNRIHTLIDRAMLSNMMSVLTDCPHREKLGWLEQTHLAGSSLMYNYDLASLYAKISDDMQDAQLPNGMVPDIAPEFTVFDGPFRDSPEWGAAVVLSPWTNYQFHGDREPLRAHYDSMKSYLTYLRRRTQNHLLTYGLGDWYDIGPGEPGESKLTDKGITATAIYFQMLIAIQKIAVLVGHPEDAADFEAEAQAVEAAFNQTFYHPESGTYDRGSQTANAMPLVVGLVPEEHRAEVLESLVRDIRLHTNHVTAGDIGFHYVVRALTDNGRSDVLYDMLSRTDNPSYGDQLAHGATTLTEAWDANPDSSQNHFMLGHAEEWFYRGLAGIDFDMSRDDDSRIRIQPAIVGKLGSAEASLHTPLGVITSSWRRKGTTVSMFVSIPEGCSATILLPTTDIRKIQLNGRRFDLEAAGRDTHVEGDRTVFIVKGGQYRFQMFKSRAD